jgi:beta-mannosidase
MKHVYDLSELQWTIEGYTPYVWLFERLYGGMGTTKCIDVPPVPARVPGSVQGALREAGILPDWTIGVNSRNCEWVEHRHWIYQTHIPNAWLDKRATFRLECLGLDYSGWIYVNGREAATFTGTHIPHIFAITPYLYQANNVLEIIFDQPPRWLGQFGYTSQMKEWKTRFNYTWDWTPRLVQIGIWDSISLVTTEGSEISNLRCVTDADPQKGTGSLEIAGTITPGETTIIQVSLEKEGNLIRGSEYTVVEFQQGIFWYDLPIELWWPNLEGEQPLYTVTCRLLDAQGNEHDRIKRRIGFKHVEWVPCEGASVEADPWVCVVNDRPVFLQGVNFAPIRSNYADLTREDYEKRLKLYRELGCNIFRINACQFLERHWFYDLCDELGLMVWQEFPLTSSGIDNWPPEEEASVAEMAEIARSFIERRQHHVSLTLWSGGNELQGDMEGCKTGIGKPCDDTHPMLKRLQEVVQSLDPGRRYIPTSPSGPRAGATSADFGKGLHWDVHGPNAAMSSFEEAEKYWAGDDALFRSEVYCSGASSMELIQQYAGGFQLFPPTAQNPYWNHPTTWWIDWERLISVHAHEPKDLTEYVEWSQAYQARMLSLGMETCKKRFPRCGGFLLWSGHDTFPMPINSSIIDFEGTPKPAAFAMKRIWLDQRGE